MGIFERVERRLERTVNGVFARAFKADVQPVEIASAIRKAMDDRAVTPSRGHVLVPNVFTVVLSSSDYERLSEFEDDIIDELVVSAEEHVDSQRYTPAGPVSVALERTDDLDTGVFRVKPSKAKQASRAGSAPAPARPEQRQDQRQTRRPEQPDHPDESVRDFNPYGGNPHDGPGAGAAAGVTPRSG
ncbi:MAG: DUF3662 domain-containing protein [Intrasporangiaceae bacterium]|nr:DUF3662 domain-containing protein [Intrasporangiaceae bacterium]